MLQSFGTLPVFRDLWKITWRIGAITSRSFWRTRGFIWSGPAALWGFRSFKNLAMPFVETVILSMWGVVKRLSPGIYHCQRGPAQPWKLTDSVSTDTLVWSLTETVGSGRLPCPQYRSTTYRPSWGGQCLWSPALNFSEDRTAFWRQVCFCEVQGLTNNLAQAVLGY